VDLWIAGGQVIDGSGAPARRADVVVRGDRVIHVGPVSANTKATRRIDASGKIVAPGFIDAHAHGRADGPNHNALAMGVTTLVIGQDGRSPSAKRSFASWAMGVKHKPKTVNVAALVGHGTVRQLTRGGSMRKLSDATLERMQKRIGAAMDAGAWGLSTGLEYAPGTLADARELAAIAKPVGARGGIIMSHLRSEDDDKIDAALDELVAQGESSGAKVHVAHIKVVFGKGEARADKLLARMQAARQRGVKITSDIYPYSASYTGISIVFPDYAKPPNSFGKAKRERRAELERYLRKRVNKRNGPQATLFGTKPYMGKTLAEVAKSKGRDFWDVLIDDIGPNGAAAAYFVMDDALQAKLLRDRHVMVSTDGSSGSRHPRGYGAFARVIRKHVIEGKHLSLEEAVRKMADLPARTLGLDKRGRLQAGWAADIVVFDPKAVRDRASYEHPNRLSRGFDQVIVNGKLVRDGGKFTRVKPGRLLLRGK
jgi:N-acyl-D-aspartate/D-glutamate deacylase